MIEKILYNELLNSGADLIGYGDLSELPSETRYNLPRGICVAVKYSKEAMESIMEHPSAKYLQEYHDLNERLDNIVSRGAQVLQENGYRAVALTRSEVEKHATDYASLLPHKTVATRAGIGWIGKSALLVTDQYGSMIRISSILTDAPLPTSEAINVSRCGDCQQCQVHCPAQAIQGNSWSVTTPRDELVNVAACRETARKLASQYIQKEITLCGKCVVSCPYTKRYLKTLERNSD